MSTQILSEYLEYLEIEKGLSNNTIEAYRRDLTSFLDLINCESEGEATEAPQITPSVDLGAAAEKLGNVTKNITESVTQQAGNIVEKAKEAAQAKPASQPRYNSDQVMEQINKLFEMKERGVLTEEEFTQKKAEFLNKLQ